MRKYHKYLIPFWIKREEEIEGSVEFGDNGECNILSNKYINHAMVSGHGILSTYIRMLVHLEKWQDATGLKITDMKSIIEVGGGLGCMANCVSFLNKSPYTIIDLPVVNKIQKHYIGTSSNVRYIGIDCLDENKDNLECDLFISCYALSECSEDMIKSVIDTKFFKAKHMLFIFGRNNFDNYRIEEFIPILKSYKGFGINDDQTYLIFN